MIIFNLRVRVFTYSSALVDVSGGNLDKDLGIPLDSLFGAGDGQVVDAVLVDLNVKKRSTLVSLLLSIVCCAVSVCVCAPSSDRS